ncbi:MAG TPA: hypothetical protein VK065_04160, partial [Brevibacterium sp.]|nr:hypothetical protein [Brevibacterium sp.]
MTTGAVETAVRDGVGARSDGTAADAATAPADRAASVRAVTADATSAAAGAVTLVPPAAGGTRGRAAVVRTAAVGRTKDDAAPGPVRVEAPVTVVAATSVAAAGVAGTIAAATSGLPAAIARPGGASTTVGTMVAVTAVAMT